MGYVNYNHGAVSRGNYLARKIHLTSQNSLWFKKISKVFFALKKTLTLNLYIKTFLFFAKFLVKVSQIRFERMGQIKADEAQKLDMSLFLCSIKPTLARSKF